MQAFFDPEIKKMNVKNAYFPLFVSDSVLQKEKDHIEGFAPEVRYISYNGLIFCKGITKEISFSLICIALFILYIWWKVLIFEIGL